ncbi:MAG TPA: NAD(P)H-dependent glycerol-3-phosphate dehydrogenase [Tepidisphaeraceae bacterium]|jgi:glycerol-3-phosphate dehydrogenase|nr:NAD(P)H-dependent glycerol-3-phosphate dehydrogenase [Tepidisphaeraceae bacterium]
MAEHVTILGDGAMATVCSILLTQGGHGVTMWGAFEESIDRLIQNREQSKLLPGARVPPSVRLTANDADCFAGATLVLSAVPTQYMRSVWQRVARYLPPGVPIVSVAKGIENKTLLRPTQVIADVLEEERGRRGVAGMRGRGEGMGEGRGEGGGRTADDESSSMGSSAAQSEISNLKSPLSASPRLRVAASVPSLPTSSSHSLAALSGPNIAAELAKYLPATAVAASDDAELAVRVQSVFSTQWFRVYTNSDVVGVELAGATKNVVAIAAGILDGLAAGNNAKSALVTRGLVEITRLGMAMGAQSDTFFGLAGLGDLITTCVSPEGRNRTVGERIGKGQKLSDILAKMDSVAEGVPTTQSVMQLARRYKVEMPITEAVYAVLFEDKDVLHALSDLMTRDPKPERREE